MLREGAWCSTNAPTARWPVRLPHRCPRAVGVNEFSFVKPVDCLGESVVIRISDRSDARPDSASAVEYFSDMYWLPQSLW